MTVLQVDLSLARSRCHRPSGVSSARVASSNAPDGGAYISYFFFFHSMNTTCACSGAIDTGLLRMCRHHVDTAARSVSVRPRRRLAFAEYTQREKSRVHECWRSPDTHPPTHALPPSASAGYSATAAEARRILLVNRGVYFNGNGRPELPRSACPRPRAAYGTVRRRAAVRGDGKHRTAATHVFHYTPRQ